jgi:hypothetical protein
MNADMKSILLPALLTPAASSNIVSDAVNEVTNILDRIDEMMSKCYRCPVALSENRCPSLTFPGDDVCRSFSKSKYAKR